MNSLALSAGLLVILSVNPYIYNSGLSINMADETPVPTCCQRMEMAGIIPQTLKQCPQDSLYLRLPGNVSDCAQVYHPLQVTSVIKISWKADPQSNYTLMLIDLDAPMRSNPILAEYLHWLVVNIPGDQVRLGQELKNYAGPTPPPDTEIHRYVFLVYRQQRAIAPHGLQNLRRPKFDHFTFANKYDLGDAMAAFCIGVETE